LVIALLLSCTTLTAQHSPAAAALTDATVQSYEQQLAEISIKQQQALNKLSDIRDDLSDAQATKQAYDELQEVLIKKKNLTEQQLEAIYQQIENKMLDQATAEANITRQREAFLNRMVTMYEEGSASYLGMVLGADDLVEFFTRIDMVNTILEYDKQVIASLEENVEKLEVAIAELEHAEDLHRSAQEVLENDILDAMNNAQQSLEYMQKLQSNESAMLKEYYKFKAQEDELNAQLEKYLQELQAKQQSAYVGGEFLFPLPLDCNFTPSSEFGWRTLWGKKDNHLGIDLAVACNTHIFAANGGKVLVSEYHYSYGNYVLIDHGGGLSTLYAHMNERKVAAGETVTRGQLIGLVGTTGASTGYHLHFEVRKDGKVTQPRDYIVLPGNK